MGGPSPPTKAEFDAAREKIDNPEVDPKAQRRAELDRISETMHAFMSEDSYHYGMYCKDIDGAGALPYSLLKQSADKGYVPAMIETGIIYQEGIHGAIQSDKKAKEYFKKAAKRGSKEAKKKLKQIKKRRENHG